MADFGGETLETEEAETAEVGVPEWLQTDEAEAIEAGARNA